MHEVNESASCCYLDWPKQAGTQVSFKIGPCFRWCMWLLSGMWDVDLSQLVCVELCVRRWLESVGLCWVVCETLTWVSWSVLSCMWDVDLSQLVCVEWYVRHWLESVGLYIETDVASHRAASVEQEERRVQSHLQGARERQGQLCEYSYLLHIQENGRSAVCIVISTAYSRQRRGQQCGYSYLLHIQENGKVSSVNIHIHCIFKRTARSAVWIFISTAYSRERKVSSVHSHIYCIFKRTARSAVCIFISTAYSRQRQGQQCTYSYPLHIQENGKVRTQSLWMCSRYEYAHCWDISCERGLMTCEYLSAVC